MDAKIPYYKTPEGKIKNREKAKRHYESRKNIVLECVACNSSFNDNTNKYVINDENERRNNKIKRARIRSGIFS